MKKSSRIPRQCGPKAASVQPQTYPEALTARAKIAKLETDFSKIYYTQGPMTRKQRARLLAIAQCCLQVAQKAHLVALVGWHQRPPEDRQATCERLERWQREALEFMAAFKSEPWQNCRI